MFLITTTIRYFRNAGDPPEVSASFGACWFCEVAAGSSTFRWRPEQFHAECKLVRVHNGPICALDPFKHLLYIRFRSAIRALLCNLSLEFSQYGREHSMASEPVGPIKPSSLVRPSGGAAGAGRRDAPFGSRTSTKLPWRFSGARWSGPHKGVEVWRVPLRRRSGRSTMERLGLGPSVTGTDQLP